MKTIIKKNRVIGLVIVCIICLIGFVFPFIIKANNDTIISVLSLSFTAVAAIATVATFIIAVLLYDRFGLERKFIENQTEKVFELADLLKGKVITARIDKYNYLIRPSRTQLNEFNSLPFYPQYCKKRIAISMEDYYLSLGEILVIKRSYWLPSEIKEKMKFLEIALIYPSTEDCVKLEFKKGESREWNFTIPEMTFESFIMNLHDLVKAIEDWLEKHSAIPIDLKLEEPNKF